MRLIESDCGKRKIALKMILLVCTLFSLVLFVSGIETDSVSYFVGDIVRINIEPHFVSESYGLEIISEEFVYRYLDLIQEDVSFIPKKAGTYQLELIDKRDDSVVSQPVLRRLQDLQY